MRVVHKVLDTLYANACIPPTNLHNLKSRLNDQFYVVYKLFPRSREEFLGSCFDIFKSCSEQLTVNSRTSFQTTIFTHPFQTIFKLLLTFVSMHLQVLTWPYITQLKHVMETNYSLHDRSPDMSSWQSAYLF